MNTASKHLSRYPKARTSTLLYIEAKDAKTAELRAEIELAKKPKTRLAEIVKKLNELIARRWPR